MSPGASRACAWADGSIRSTDWCRFVVPLGLSNGTLVLWPSGVHVIFVYSARNCFRPSYRFRTCEVPGLIPCVLETPRPPPAEHRVEAGKKAQAALTARALGTPALSRVCTRVARGGGRVGEVSLPGPPPGRSDTAPLFLSHHTH